MISFSLALAASSTFLVKASIIFWISSCERFSSSSLTSLSFINFFTWSLASRRILRKETRCSSAMPCSFLASSLRRSSLSEGIGMRISLPSFEGLKPNSAKRIALLIAAITVESHGAKISARVVLHSHDPIVATASGESSHALAISSEKIKKETGWRKQMDLNPGLASTVYWYAANRDWINHVNSVAYRDYFTQNYQSR